MQAILLDEGAFQNLLNEIQEIKSLLRSLQKDQAQKDKWLNTNEAAQILKVTPRTLQNYRDLKQISFSQIGSKIYYRLSDIEAFLMKHHMKGRDDI